MRREFTAFLKGFLFRGALARDYNVVINDPE
jgi:hypothetical protein